jgi:uncharacterized membrane protein YwaF
VPGAQTSHTWTSSPLSKSRRSPPSRSWPRPRSGAARALPGAWIVPFARTLAVLILAAYVAEQIAIVARGTWSIVCSLPLELTDAVTIVAAVALWSPRPLAFELAYFWGLTASLQAVVTPDLDSAFPSLFFFT